MGRRGALSVHDGTAGEEEVVDERDSAIYVSMTDPVGRPSFKPGPTKPIPRWMRPFDNREPDEVDEELMELVRQHREVQKRLEAGEESRSEASETSTICPAPSSPVKDDTLEQKDGPQRPITHRGTSWVSAEPNKVPSSLVLERINADANLSSSTFATYHTPPEYPSSARTSVELPSKVGEIGTTETPDTPLVSLDRSRSFYSVRPPTSIVREQGTQNPLWRLGKTNQRRPVPASGTYRVSSSIAPLASSEFLERFQSGRAASMSVSSTPRASDTFSLRRDGALRGTIVGKLRKNSRPDPNTSQVMEDATDPRLRPRSNTAEVAGDGQNQNKRRSVQAELKRLFGR